MASSAPAEAGALYLGYDRDGLEAQYNLRISHPDRDAVYEEYRLRSAAFREAAGGRYDVPYGPAERQRLDIFPGATPDAPVFVFFHGGYWRALDKSKFTFVAEPFLRAGWGAVLANYTLAPNETIDAIVEQARAALSAVCATFPETRRIVVSGHSAGGQLTLMSILTDWARRGGPTPPIVAGIPISGVFDLEPLRHTTINELLHLDAGAAARNSPIHLIRPSPVPLLVAAGGNETDEFRGQSARFVDAWKSAGNRADMLLTDGDNHFTVLRAFADPAGPFQEKIWDFLDGL